MYLNIGPRNVLFDLSVGRYLRSGAATSSDKTCLRKFFDDVRNGSVQVVAHTVGDTLHIGRCNHLVRAVDDGSTLHVLEIQPPITGGTTRAGP